MPVFRYLQTKAVTNSFKKEVGDLEFAFHGKAGYGELIDSENATNGAIWMSDGDATGCIFDRVEYKRDQTQALVAEAWIAIMHLKDGIASCSCYRWTVNNFTYDAREDMLNFGICEPYIGQEEDEVGDE